MFASPPCCRARIETTQQRGITGATSGRPTERHEDTEDNRRGRPLNKTTGIASSISEQRSVLAPLLPRSFAGQLSFENRAPFGRLLCRRFGFCKNIHFMPE